MIRIGEKKIVATAFKDPFPAVLGLLDSRNSKWPPFKMDEIHSNILFYQKIRIGEKKFVATAFKDQFPAVLDLLDSWNSKWPNFKMAEIHRNLLFNQMIRIGEQKICGHSLQRPIFKLFLAY